MAPTNTPNEVDFGILGKLPCIENVKNAVNERFDNLLYVSEHQKEPKLFVCCFCDEFVIHEKDRCWLTEKEVEKAKDHLTWSNVLDAQDRVPRVEACFKLEDVDSVLKNPALLQNLGLSPRGTLCKLSARQGARFSSCIACRSALASKESHTPLWAIVNSNHVGHAPTILNELTMEERAMLHSVNGYGYCFTYKGGKEVNLKGCMSFMRIEERKIGRAILHLEKLGLSNSIVILMTGAMTKGQVKKVENKIRPGKLIEAVEWMAKENRNWADVDLDEVRAELQRCKPVLVNRSDEVESGNANIEETELFTCYFPEGASNETQGGFDDTESFKEFVKKKQADGFDIRMECALTQEFVQGSDTDHLTRACLLQFPHGIGGLRDDRLCKDGSITKEHDTLAYLEHLSRLSQPVFQQEFFQLILYSIACKVRLFKTSRLQVRGSHTADLLAKGINAEDVTSTIRNRRSGYRHRGSLASRKLLDSVDACSRALAHTAQAAKTARATGEAMQHHFGIPSVFLTVAFDDENSVLMQQLCGKIIDDDTPLSTLNDNELSLRCKERFDLRKKYPGASALAFEMLENIVTEEVVGWDKRRNCTTENPGFFGRCNAMSVAYEEQGRKTVHAHMCLWIEGFRELQHNMYFGNTAEQRDAGALLAAFQERICSTELFKGSSIQLNYAFNHPCSQPVRERRVPATADDQTLRDLRNKLGYKEHEGAVAYCTHCDHKFTYESLVNGFVRQRKEFPTMKDDDSDNIHDIPKARMAARIVEYTKTRNAPVHETPVTCINAQYNCHSSCHRPSCFKCQGSSRKTHVCGPKCECRYRLPDRPRPTAIIRTVYESKAWFDIFGNRKDQPIVQFLPKRAKYDVFQNSSCPAISETKLACNSNAQVITDGPLGQYQFKYHLKNTQKDDVREYAEVEKDIKQLANKKHDDSKKEAVRMITRAAFAHNKTNVIGAPLASFLTRHATRFYFSHDFVYCPIKDIAKLLHKEPVSALANSVSGEKFFENQALHYMCRPLELEEETPFSFYSEFTVIPKFQQKKRKRKGTEETEVYEFVKDTGHFKHPSCRVNKNGTLGAAKQAVREKEKHAYVKVPQWLFPDTGMFRENILTCHSSLITRDMETYAQYVLILFSSYRCREDLLPETNPLGPFPYVRKFREVNAMDYQRKSTGCEASVFTEENENFLQNIQNCAYNSLRFKMAGDDLESVTVPFSKEGINVSGNDSDDEEEELEPDVTPYDLMLNALDCTQPNDEDPAFLRYFLKGFDFGAIRNKGRKRCGRRASLPLPTDELQYIRPDFVTMTTPLTLDDTHLSNYGSSNRFTYKRRDVVKVILEKTQTKKRPSVFQYNPDVEVLEANGTIRSIRAWAKAAKLDAVQMRAFECLVAAFLLTFFEEVEDLDNPEAGNMHSEVLMFDNIRAHLFVLKGDKSAQLICLIHGPGGSGKSTVINLVVAYSREFCELIGHPFTKRTIVITAFTGVAAILLHGETIHKALGLNIKNFEGEIARAMREAWVDTRMLIVDECSFGSQHEYDAIYRNLQYVMAAPFLPYGGQNVVFAGDFSQLEPPGKEPIYKHDFVPSFHGGLNTYIELSGMHRFKDDIPWGHRNGRFREGEPTLEDIRLLNETCVVRPGHEPPFGTQVACHQNKDRDAINSAIFEEFCEMNYREDNSIFEGACMIFMDNLDTYNADNVFVEVRSNSLKRLFWETCGEDSCHFPAMAGKRVDPVLKLYLDCPLMFTDNKDVSNGQANGSRVFLRNIVVKQGESFFPVELSCGTRIRAYLASQIDYLVVEHEIKDIEPARFKVYTDTYTFTAQMHVENEKTFLKMRGKQFSVISNNATTGHKLQGYTAQSLYVNDWHYGQNWVYVVLSRVRKMLGLFLGEKLSEDLSKYAMPPRMKAMLQRFRDTISIRKVTEEQYAAMMAVENHNTANVRDLLRTNSP